jgi:hypothetical protein
VVVVAWRIARDRGRGAALELSRSAAGSPRIARTGGDLVLAWSHAAPAAVRGAQLAVVEVPAAAQRAP